MHVGGAELPGARLRSGRRLPPAVHPAGPRHEDARGVGCAPVAGRLARHARRARETTGGEAMNAGLRALLAGLIDYAGLFPPAKLPMDVAVRNYLKYRDEPESWMLGRFICPASRLGELAAFQDEIGDRPLVVSALARGGETASESLAGLQADFIDRVHCEAQHKGRVITDMIELRVPADLLASPGRMPAWVREVAATVGVKSFFEIPAQAENLRSILSAIRGGPFHDVVGVKLRCGGLDASAFPSSASIATVLWECAGKVLPFKATAGLHHPFPRFHDGVKARMHGFINLFAAGVFVWHRGIDAAQAAMILDDADSGSFRFDDDGLRYNDLHVSAAEIQSARLAFALSFGSCSFDEPRDDLRALGWL